MKKIYYIISAIIFLSVLNNCSDDQFAKYYPDPSQTVTVSCDKLMTGVFWSSRAHTLGDIYWKYVFDKNQPGIYAQTMGFVNTPGNYAGVRNFQQNRWRDFYYTLAQYRQLQTLYNDLPEEEKEINEVFELIARTFVYSQLEDVVDIWGSVPFSEAGFLSITNDLANARAKYDDAVTIYTEMIDDLDIVNDRFSGMINEGIPAVSTIALSKQDYINGGDLTKWQRFANSLRLRMALRVSSQGQLASKGREVLSQMLSNPAKYPLIETLEQVTKIDADGDAFKNDMGDPWGGVRGAFEDGTNESSFMRVSLKMIEIMGVVDGNMTDDSDPRIPVFMEKIEDGPRAGLYVGVDPLAAEGTQTADWSHSEGVQYSRPSRVTFARNENFPGIIFTAAETWFIKAEAFQMGWAAGNAEEAFIQGVAATFEYYYWLNNISTVSPRYNPPSSAEIHAFASLLWNKDGNKQKTILEQKWLNFAFIQMREAWHDVRRTGYPELAFMQHNDAPEVKTPPYRLMYPDNEKTGNRENWEAMQSQDGYYNNLFWAKEGGYYTIR